MLLERLLQPAPLPHPIAIRLHLLRRRRRPLRLQAHRSSMQMQRLVVRHIPIPINPLVSRAPPLLSPKQQPLLNQPLDLHAILYKQQLRERRLHARPDHARQPLRAGIREQVPEIAELALGPDGDGAGELLQPDGAPVLAEGPREELEVLEHLQPFVQVELEVCFGGGAEVAAAPAAAFAVRDGAADGAAGGEEEEVDVRVDLGDDAELGVELRVEGFERDVGAQGAVFPFVAEAVRGELAGVA